ncbi:MAG: cobalt transporter, inner rane subunit CbiQ [Anaerocolumna sp.]|jgi:cobalt/nickel transport system permease protein|nr:cobalt transporter, inner rane subunit CbiQ [Anaerocolumna sp.]
MNRLSNAMNEIYELDELAERKKLINELHPLVKLFITLFYIICVVSFDKYDLFGLLPMIIYPLITFNIADISIKKGFKKLRIVIPMVCILGLFNPILDRTAISNLYGVAVSGGFVSMLTLILKGILSLLASFLLIATTGIDSLCYALKKLHIPGIIVTQIHLLYRYITVLLSEANSVFEAYSLRAPKEKGIKYKIWGTLLGQLLFRSLDRAEKIYDSMLLRGFTGEFYYAGRQKWNRMDGLYFLLWLMIIASIKLLNIVL